MLLLGKTESHS